MKSFQQCFKESWDLPWSQTQCFYFGQLCYSERRVLRNMHILCYHKINWQTNLCTRKKNICNQRGSKTWEDLRNPKWDPSLTGKVTINCHGTLGDTWQWAFKYTCCLLTFLMVLQCKQLHYPSLGGCSTAPVDIAAHPHCATDCTAAAPS